MHHVRKFLGQRLRALRKQRGWSQQELGQRSGLSGKFIGEVERGEKSVSVDSLSGVSQALKLPLRTLTDVPSINRPVPGEDAEKVFALIQNRTPAELRRATSVLRSVFGAHAGAGA